MAFSNEDIMSYFCATGPNPLASKIPEHVDILPTPGHGLYTRGKEREKERERERRRREEDDIFGPRSSEPPQPESPGFDEPKYNLDGTEDVDVSEDYFQPAASNVDESSYVVRALYDRYSFSVNRNPHLPVTERREDLIRSIESNQVTIVQGATGSGKSTLVPQYILEHYAMHTKHCNIVCTQPRRIATRSIARYVAESRGWNLGSLVGYHIYNDKVTSEDTRLTFVTTGVLLEKLVSMKNMNEFTHVILDEVRCVLCVCVCM